MEKLLTKSKYMTGLSCLRSLWYEVNDKGKLPKIPEFDQFGMDCGIEAGEFAKKYFPEGIDVDEIDIQRNIEKTKVLLEEKKTIIEAGTSADRIFSRADMLKPVGDEWDIIEVKASNSVKKDHYDDLSFQRYCCQKAGLKIRKTWLMHLNGEYIKKGELDVKELFVLEDITDKVLKTMEGIKKRIAEMISVIDLETPPGKCEKPSSCKAGLCWNDLPENNVFELYKSRKPAKFYASGIKLIKDVPDSELNDKQGIQKEAVISGEVQVNKEKVKEFLDTLHNPIYLDFETFSTGLPMYDGTRPWQQITFQFVAIFDGKVTSFIYDGEGDPRKECLEKLKEALSGEGSIVVFNKTFEVGRIKEFGRDFDCEEWASGVIARIVDLHDPFKEFWYYDPKQHGSGSLKAVLPALTGKGYDDLDIGEGGEASLTYYRAHTGVTDKSSFPALEAYCTRDVEGMVWIVEKLKL